MAHSFMETRVRPRQKKKSAHLLCLVIYATRCNRIEPHVAAAEELLETIFRAFELREHLGRKELSFEIADDDVTDVVTLHDVLHLSDVVGKEERFDVLLPVLNFPFRRAALLDVMFP